MKKSILFILLTTIVFAGLYCQNNRPQEPQGPYDYNSEDVSIENKRDSILLAGTFTYPKSGSDFPSVILISGSGPQDRNSEILNHKPFLVIADYLTKNGIAVLRVDDRGAGESQGDHNKGGLNGFVNDAKSAINFLRSRKEVEKSKIGLLGHSLGGIVAPIVASESDMIAFIVLLAAPGIRGDSLMLLQKEKIERKMDVPEIGIAMGQNNIKGAYDIILQSEINNKNLDLELKEYFTTVFGAMLPENQIEAIANQLSMAWFVDLIRYDPRMALSKISCPVLALNGTYDLQVPSKENLEAISGILEENGNDKYEIHELEKLNHLFQECESGLPQEYGEIEQTFSPTALDIIGAWISKVCVKY